MKITQDIIKAIHQTAIEITLGHRIEDGDSCSCGWINEECKLREYCWHIEEIVVNKLKEQNENK